MPQNRLHTLTKKQNAVLQSGHRFNIVAGARDSGKTMIADRIVLRKSMARPGSVVLYCLPDDDEAEAARRRLLSCFEGLPKCPVKGEPAQRRIRLNGGGSIYLITPGKIPASILSTAVLVVDNAQKIDGFADFWEKTLRPLVGSGSVWIFAKPRGAKDGFGSLFRQAQSGVDARWKAINLTTLDALSEVDLEDPPAAQQRVERRRAQVEAEIAEAAATLPPAAFLQEYEGEVVDEPIELSLSQTIIGKDETFLQWCDRLAETGLKVDNHPFRLDDRPTMRWIYSLVPSTPEEAFGQQLVLMKCAQVGFTVMEMLAMIYLALKFMPCKIGMFLPGRDLAILKSSERFMPIVRTVPDAHKLMLDNPSGTTKGEGNVLVRNMGESRFHFLWTSGRTTTESVPMDVVSFDEVQEMAISDMEKTRERMSASRIRYTLMGSTANWPDRDIHFFYKKGTQHQFWTECPSCGEHQILDDYFPECVSFRDGDYRYVCHACDGVILDAQKGEWRPANPEARFVSIHYPQFLSPTISPREMIEGYFEADDMKNFFNRKRGKPYVDPTQVPVNLEMLNECAELGMKLGVVWKGRAAGTFMGIDQMGAFNVVLIAERLASGHMAIIHAEEIYDEDPFARCDQLMAQYGVAVCCVETLPNYNDAKRFAGRHPGKVFLAGYMDLKEDMLRWGDSVPNSAERKTSEEDRDRWTVMLDQYKCMQVAMRRIQQRVCVFPDPMGLVQEIRDKGLRPMVPVLKERVFLHFTRTALIAEKDDEERKYRRRVVKIGLDPHFSYAFMLLNVAWARSHGTTMFLTPLDGPAPDSRVEKVAQQMPGLPSGVLGMLAAPEGSCGACSAYADGVCSERGFLVQLTDPGCEMFIAKSTL